MYFHGRNAIEGTSKLQVRYVLESMYDDRITCTASPPDGKLLVTGGEASVVRIWRVADGAAVRTLQGHTSHVMSVCCTADGATGT